MALNLSLIVIEMWIGAGLIVLLHWISPRYGLAPFFVLVGMLLMMVRLGGLLQPFVRATPDLVFGITGNVLVPLIVFSVLLIYVTQGTIPARTIILTGLGLDVLFTLMLAAIRTHLMLEGGVSFAGIMSDDSLVNPPLASTFASSGAFLIDLLVVAIVYQALDNVIPRLPRWARIGLTLIVTLAINSIAFSSFNLILGVSDFERFITRMPGRLIGQTISALLLLPIAAYYIQVVAPRLPGFVGFDPRPTFDLIFGTRGRIERELHETQLELDRTIRAYENLADEISHTTHDLKNPLSAILIRLHTLTQTQDAAEHAYHIEAARKQVEILGELIDDLLILSRLDETPLLDVHVVDMNVLAEEVYLSLEPLAEEKGQTLRFDPEDRPLPVAANALEMVRALTNLTMNAFHYTPQGGKITIETGIEEEAAVFRVRDNGIGIAQDEVEQIWNRFYRAPNQSVQSTNGTGLGLAIVKKVIERHEGQVDVDSQPGKGATFKIRMKLQAPTN